jgi:hypothetical protein
MVGDDVGREGIFSSGQERYSALLMIPSFSVDYGHELSRHFKIKKVQRHNSINAKRNSIKFP